MGSIGNLAALAAKQTAEAKKIVFSDSDAGHLSHDGDGEPVLTVDLVYIGQARAAELAAAATRRRISSVKKRTNEFVHDATAGTRAVCAEAVKGWDISVAACRRLRAPLDYTKTKPEDKISFNAENLAFMVEKSDFGILILNCLNDFNYHHPEEAAQLGNSGSGPTGSTSASTAPAAPA